jgi:ribonuclease BN (tRNA processing enzyme)
MLSIRFLGVEGYPTQEKETISILIRNNNNNILLDCGASIIRQVERAQLRISDLQAIFISHIHADHSSGLPLVFFGNIMERFNGLVDRKGHLKLIGQKVVLEKLIAYCKSAYPLLWNENPMLTIEEFLSEDKINLDLGWSKISTFSTSHAVPASGICVETNTHKICYSSDTRKTDTLVEAARNADLLICSMLGPNDTATTADKFGFMSPNDAGLIAKESNCKKLVLIHIAKSSSREICKKEAAQVFNGDIFVPNNDEEMQL